MKNNILVPWFVTAYTDAEGSFHFSVFPSSSSSVGWQVKLELTIDTFNNSPNLKLLECFKDFFIHFLNY